VRRPRFTIESSLGRPGSIEADHFWWRLVGANGETIGVSETYTRREDAVRGAKAARRAAYLATIEQPD
jgi:uncharacterized protein YegP (UPF0339 family)